MPYVEFSTCILEAMATEYPLQTKSLRSKEDFEDYIKQFNDDNFAGYAAYYSRDIFVRYVLFTADQNSWLQKATFEYV